MSGLEDAYDRGSRWRVVGRALVLFAGSLVAAVGFVAAAASLVAGFGVGKATALEFSVLLGGTLLLAGFLLPSVRAPGAGRSRVLAGVGVAAGVAGLALFWLRLPTGWTGNLGQLPPAALGTYGVGLLVAFWAGVGAESADAGRDAATRTDSASGRDDAATGGLGGVTSALGNDADGSNRKRAPASSAVGDGGEEDGNLRFFDGDGES